MHTSVQEWVAAIVAQHGLATLPTLEVGSRNVNGSARKFFSGDYAGIDMEAGSGVDIVARADSIPFPADTFMVVVCTEMLEHDPYPWRSLPEMARVLAPSGHLLLTTRGPEFPYHEYPGDFYRYTPDAITVLVHEVARLHIQELVPDPLPGHPGVFVHATKGGAS